MLSKRVCKRKKNMGHLYLRHSPDNRSFGLHSMTTKCRRLFLIVLTFLGSLSLVYVVQQPRPAPKVAIAANLLGS
jgi:hypothetical protein